MTAPERHINIGIQPEHEQRVICSQAVDNGEPTFENSIMAQHAKASSWGKDRVKTGSSKRSSMKRKPQVRSHTQTLSGSEPREATTIWACCHEQYTSVHCNTVVALKRRVE